MNTKDLIRLGVPVGEPIQLAYEFIQNFIAQGKDGALLEAEIFNVVANPPAFFADELRAPLARAIYRPAFTPRAELAPWRQWGEGLEAEAVKQMANACAPPSRPSTSPHFPPPPPRRWPVRLCRMRFLAHPPTSIIPHLRLGGLRPADRRRARGG
jgi:hypothetical protein